MPDPVDVINIGPVRGATSWMWIVLSLHPEISICKPKELNYFVDKYHLGLNWYKQHFAHPERVRVDVSPECYFHAETVGRIQETAPNARMLCVLRNPYDRAINQLYFFHRQRKGTTVGLDLAALRENQEGLERCLRGSEYYARLEPFLEAFPRERFSFLFFDTLAEDPWRLVRQIYEAVGVSGEFRPPESLVREQVNTARMEARSPLLFTMLRRAYLASYRWKPTGLLMDFLERRFDVAFKVYRVIQRPLEGEALPSFRFDEIFGPEGKARLEADMRRFQEATGITLPAWTPR